jgi:phosphoglycerate dehydrogenase-like enzyme
LDTLLRTADVVSLHLKLTNDSRALIGRRAFGIMKPGTILINCARGEIVATEALIEALDSGHLAGAGIDVYDQEPTSVGHPLLGCEQVVFTPHCADMTPEGVDRLNDGAVENVIAFIEGCPQNVVS